MKSVLYSILFFFVLAQSAFAQSVPQGMKYQAVARDVRGQVITEQPLYIKITLYSDPVRQNIAYVELHKVKTNSIGLFDLTIGDGQNLKGTFEDIPWAAEEIWIEVAVQSPDAGEYLTISNSRMLSVPYAFHAATASELIGHGRNGNNGSGVPSQNWSLFGNKNSDPAKDKLGTTDYTDLVIVTDDIERMRILANGNIDIDKSLHIGEDLTVDRNVYLNVLSGETINYGDLTVENQSSTLLSGTLTVDLATDLNSSLNVDGITNLNSSTFVNNMSPTVLTGTLRTDKDALFKEHVLLDNASHQSTSVNTGALVVNGGVGIGKNLNVGGDAKFGGMVEFAGMVNITDETESTGLGTGALKVAGGTSIGKRLNVGGAASLLNTLSVTGATTLNNTLGVSGITSLNNTTESSATNNGSLVVAGGAGIAKNLNVGGSLNVKNSNTYIANFENTNSSGNGISIKINNAAPDRFNNFVTFLNSSFGIVGRIEGETTADLPYNQDYQEQLSMLNWEIFFASVDEATAIADEIQAGVDLVGASTSSTACVGLGACVTTPVPSLIVAAAAGLVVATANLVASSAALAMAIDNRATFESEYASRMGVTYASGSGDYAEYIPKLDINEKFTAGDIVGMKHGFITKSTLGADRIMVISHKPIVLGKLPADGNDENYEKVAFLGQVPAKVMGAVNKGDYILSSGFHNGMGIARHPDHMSIEDYDRILGVAWESATANRVNMVNVAIGLNTNDMTSVIRQQAEKIAQQESQMAMLNNQLAQTNSILAKLVPGFAESIGENNLVQVEQLNRTTPTTALHPDDHNDVHFAEHNEGDIVYFEITRNQLEEGIEMARSMYAKAGIDLDKHPFWQRLANDASYKNEILNDMQVKLQNAYHTHKQVNENSGK